jgi:hypothetical protein
MRSVVLFGVFATKLPAAQVFQGEHSLALGLVLKLALLQALHERSLCSLGSWLTYWPRVHRVYARHGVAGLAS